MKNAARVVLAVVLLAGGLLVPRLGFTDTARAGIGVPAQVPTPLLSELLGEPEPEKTDDPDEGGGDPDEPDEGGSDDPDGGGGDGNKSGGDNRNGKNGRDGDGKAGRGDGKGDGKGGLDGKRGKGKKGRKGRLNVVPAAGTPEIPGAFNTNELLAVAGHLRSLGWSAEEVIAQVYPPFIIAGESTFIDTWGAPRYGPGPIVRTHEGQDVFCDYGDPVLAPEDGYVSFSIGGLGGVTARVHTPDGAYWYLTHLSDLNTEELSNGEQVTAGTVIGFCGNSGNAASTPPHVHFGWYQPNGEALNPMRSLVRWLRLAEARAAQLLVAATGERQKQLPTLTAARRFGDAFAPDRSLFLGGESESLWASGRSPATGAFAVAEAALQAALAEHVDAPSFVGVPMVEEGAGDTSTLDPRSALARLLNGRFTGDENVD